MVFFLIKKNLSWVPLWWLIPVVLATQEAEIKRIKVQNQQIVCETLSQKHPTQKRVVKWSSGRVPA
jgi:hypothetical protein